MRTFSLAKPPQPRHSLYISNHDIDWNIEAFDRLVLASHKKELVKALVTVHLATAASTDVIEGKGNGLIMLLHSGPGTGKTLTAESVAELTGKPLYRVTCGDIGTNPEDDKECEAMKEIEEFRDVNEERKNENGVG